MHPIQYDIIVDHSETANKCTILPLRYRNDFTISRFAASRIWERSDTDFLLHPEGVCLSKVSRPITTPTKILVIDCIWRRLPVILKHLGEPLPNKVKIPEGFITAYPRKSRGTGDPDGGLATIEALFITAAFLNFWDETLLTEYHFAPAFIDLNRRTFASYGITISDQLVIHQQRPKSSQDRRLARGRMPKTLGQ